MKKSEVIQIIKEEIESILKEQEIEFDMLKDDDVMKVSSEILSLIKPVISSKLNILKIKKLKPSKVADKIQVQVINNLRKERFVDSEKIKKETQRILALSNALKMPSSVAGPVK